MLIDPDAPTPEEPKFAFWRHWVISGLKPDTVADERTPALTEYLGPGPKPEYARCIEHDGTLWLTWGWIGQTRIATCFCSFGSQQA